MKNKCHVCQISIGDMTFIGTKVNLAIKEGLISDKSAYPYIKICEKCYLWISHKRNSIGIDEDLIVAEDLGRFF